jgi:hypothetical protein
MGDSAARLPRHGAFYNPRQVGGSGGRHEQKPLVSQIVTSGLPNNYWLYLSGWSRTFEVLETSETKTAKKPPRCTIWGCLSSGHNLNFGGCLTLLSLAKGF